MQCEHTPPSERSYPLLDPDLLTNMKIWLLSQGLHAFGNAYISILNVYFKNKT